jgi:hypothetical protein
MINAHFYTFGAWLLTLEAFALVLIAPWAGIGFLVCALAVAILTPSGQRQDDAQLIAAPSVGVSARETDPNAPAARQCEGGWR